MSNQRVEANRGHGVKGGQFGFARDQADAATADGRAGALDSDVEALDTLNCAIADWATDQGFDAEEDDVDNAVHAALTELKGDSGVNAKSKGSGDLYELNDVIRAYADAEGIDYDAKKLDNATHAAAARLDNGWESMESDQDDHQIAADDAVRMSGLENVTHGELWWGHEGSPEDMIGYDADIDFARIETDYLTTEMADEARQLAADLPDTTVYARAWANRGNDSMTAERNQYNSVSLTEDETQAVIDRMVAEGFDEFPEDMVAYWSQGDPQGLDDTFGLSSPRRTWDEITEHVTATHPQYAPAIDFAKKLRTDVCTQFDADCTHMWSDEWKKEEYERRNS